MRLVSHVVIGKGIAENLEVLCLQITGIFLNLLKVWVSAPLPNLMTDHWLIVLGDEFLIVCTCLWWTSIDARGVAIFPGLDSWSGCAEKIILWKKRPTSAAGMQATRLLLFPVS